MKEILWAAITSAGVTTALLAAAAFLLKTYIGERVKHEYDKLLASHNVKLETDKRVHAEIVRWANPILGAVDALQWRLENILEREGYLALRQGFSKEHWSMTYEYMMNSTLYVFAAYFCWVQLLTDRMSFELFSGGDERKQFFNAIDDVRGALSWWPLDPECAFRDAQVFAQQQRAIGDMLVHDAGGQPACMSFHAFEESLRKPEVRRRIAPLRALLEEISPDRDCRWRRLQNALAALRKLAELCEALLNTKRDRDRPPLTAEDDSTSDDGASVT